MQFVSVQLAAKNDSPQPQVFSNISHDQSDATFPQHSVQNDENIAMNDAHSSSNANS